MRLLSATEAISPAINRTKAILFQPFCKGRTWKLAATAYLSAMGLVFIPYYPLIFFATPLSPGQQEAHIRIFMAVASLFVLAIMLLFFYLGSRLQFVLFAIAAEKADMVAPLWRRYATHTWPWLGLKLILSLIVTAVFAVPIFYAFRSLITHMPVQPGQPPSPEMFAGLFLFYLFFIAPIAILMLCSSLLSDFVLPPIALEDATIADALGRFFQLIKAEPMQLSVYVLFKVLLAIAGMIAMQVVVMLAEILALIPLGILAALGWFLFRSAGPIGHILFIAGGITLGLALGVFLIYVSILVMGCVHMFYQAYALYFLGGRYPLLGDILEPPLPPLTEQPSFQPAS